MPIVQHTTDPLATVYKSQAQPSSDGIGKIYMGREISQVMGHQGAGWLERPSRSISEQPQQFIPALNLEPTDTVADIGAGTGFISFRLAPLLPEGKVLAVDVQPEMLEILESVQQQRQIANIQGILGTEKNPNLAHESVDLALMVDAYHEFAYPREMMEAVTQALKPGGRVVLVEYKAENPLIFIKPHHKMSVRQVRKEMQAVGLKWKGNQKVLPQQHVLTFQKSL
ncbi:class I SAM-dependent methyltransferase [Acaryochloris thomasi]|uniref:class I SAM-dependent methyltransferase n=1 Tax=Acaryochloris thomasi TaxID=2929456 RepID=UPI00351D95B4